MGEEGEFMLLQNGQLSRITIQGYGFQERVGMIAKTLQTRINTGFLKSQNGVWQRFGNI